MKVAAHIILLCCVTLYSLSAPVMWGLYYLQADAIARVYCVNPDKPSCHGKCHMAKLMSKKGEKDDAPPLIEQNIEKPLLFFARTATDNWVAERAALPYGIPPSSTLHSGYPQSIYHPPV